MSDLNVQMQSRLPKPKINLSSVINNTVNPSVEKSDQKMTKSHNDPTSHASSSGISNKLEKAKSTMNIAKCTNENKPPPPKQTLIRSKTMSSINTRAVKRPAVAPIAHGETKKPTFAKPPVKTTITQRTGTTLKNNVTSKSSQDIGAQKVRSTIIKPSKWDLKGQLAQKTDELSTVRQKYKETKAENDELQERVNTLKTSENTYKLQAEEYEHRNKTLDNELQELKIKINKLQEEKENLIKCLKESENLYKNASDMLVEVQQKCSSQEILLSKHELTVENLKTNLEVERKMNKELSAVKSDLENLVHTMDKDRRVLHNAIQELKGNIRVFCRVRPKTQNELGKAYVYMNV